MPLHALQASVPAEWIDFNGHMSAPWYCVAFGEANDLCMEQLGLGGSYRASSGFGLYAVSARYHYRHEMHEGEAYSISSWLAAVTDKCLSLTHCMLRADGATAAEAEILFLHVHRHGPRAAPFSPEMRARLSSRATIADPIP